MEETEKITSRENQKLKLVRKIRDGKFDELIFIEGVRLVEEALRSNVSIVQCYVSTGFAKSERRRELLVALEKRELQLFEVSDSIFQSIAETNNAQGVILIAKRPESSVFLATCLVTVPKQLPGFSGTAQADRYRENRRARALPLLTKWGA